MLSSKWTCRTLKGTKCTTNQKHTSFFFEWKKNTNENKMIMATMLYNALPFKQFKLFKIDEFVFINAFCRRVRLLGSAWLDSVQSS